jgi:hypothetical protein
MAGQDLEFNSWVHSAGQVLSIQGLNYSKKFLHVFADANTSEVFQLSEEG